MLTGAIPEYLSIADASKSVKGQAAICDWMSNIGSCMFDVQKVKVTKLKVIRPICQTIKNTDNY